MSKEDFYHLLGVPRNATADEIKSAYRKLAMKYHPDRNPGNKEAEEEFKKANSAYETLSDAGKRRMYDQYGHAGLGESMNGFGGFGGGVDMGDVLGSIFEDVFSGGFGGRGRHSRRGADLKHDVEVTLDEAYSGVQIPVEYDRTELCETCSGTGAKPGHGLKRCAACKGSGRVQYVQGFFSLAQPCPDCGGHGEIVEKPCEDCRGSGRIRKNVKLSVKVPPGVHDGTTLRISSGGDAGARKGDSGDLYVEVRVKHHGKFDREGDDLIYKCPITFPQAALGCEIEVPVIGGGTAQLRIPEGTQHGAVFRVGGCGMPKLGVPKKKGDLHVVIAVEVPRQLTELQRELLSQFAAALNVSCEKGGSIFKKVFGS